VTLEGGADYGEVLRRKDEGVLEVLVGKVLGMMSAGGTVQHTVMRRVFEGGEGCIRAGRSARSRDNVGEWRPLEVWLEDREIGGVLSCWVAMMVSRSAVSVLL